jgi:hypothetical protein
VDGDEGGSVLVGTDGDEGGQEYGILGDEGGSVLVGTDGEKGAVGAKVSGLTVDLGGVG